MTTNTTTAIRTHKNGKATVTITLPDGATVTMGGARAARAEVALVGKCLERGEWYVSGLRADAKAGEAEAERIRTRTYFTIRNHVSRPVQIPCTPNPDFYAIRITEEN